MKARSVSIQIIKSGSEVDEQDVYISNEGGFNWRDIIFIPFGDFWQFVLCATIVVNSFLVIYFLAFQAKYNEASTLWLYYCMEGFYGLDIALLIAHK